MIVDDSDANKYVLFTCATSAGVNNRPVEMQRARSPTVGGQAGAAPNCCRLTSPPTPSPRLSAGATSHTDYAGINRFDSRCCAYGVVLAVASEIKFPSAEEPGRLPYPKGYKRREP